MAQRIDRFYIGQVEGQGRVSDLKPFAIADNAFAELNNAYVFRGRVRKRFGAQLMRGTTAAISGLEQIQSRFKINLGSTDGAGDLALTVPGATFQIGQAFSVGSEFLTVYQTGTPGALMTTGSSVSTYNTTTGALSIVAAAAATVVYFYPAQPVMGLVTLETPSTNVEDVVGFDTQFAYQFTSNGWVRLGTAVWTGDNSKFFWGTNWDGIVSSDNYLFVTNYSYAATLTGSDPIRYWNGSAWTDFTPAFSATTSTSIIMTARIILPFKGRLVLLNVVENTVPDPAFPGINVNKVYSNRCRYSWVGSPVPLLGANTSFYEAAGKGGYVDAPTKEAIITAQFLKDRLIVYFESSTWELVYTNNQVSPFLWQQINTELGAESTFSQVPFDKVVLGVGNVGIHACNGSNVDRIDDKIPDEVFEIHNDNNGIERVAGIRDYYTEMVYWTFPSSDRSTDYPFNNRILTYNYKNGTWAFNDDSITAFGYFQSTVGGASASPTWAESTMPWSEANFTWRSAILQAKFRNVIAGNQEGYTFIVNPDLSANCPALQITNISYTSLSTVVVTAINHNLEVGDFVKIDNAQGITGLNNSIFKVIDISITTFTLDIQNTAVTGTYTGAGTVTRVTPIDFKTKQFNFYSEQGKNAYLQKVDFFVDRTDQGQCTVDFYISSSDLGMIAQSALTGSMTGTSILETSPYALAPFEQQQERLWHPMYFFAEGETVQFRFYLSESQARDVVISESEFELHAFIVYAQSSSRLQ